MSEDSIPKVTTSTIHHKHARDSTAANIELNQSYLEE
jgi:hypothetical protein